MIAKVVLFSFLGGLPILSLAKMYSEKEIEEIVNKKVLKKLESLGENKMAGFSTELLKKQKQLKMMTLELKQKRELLEIDSKALNKMIKKFAKKQQDLIGCMDNIEKDKKRRANHLVKIIEEMKPVKAAALLSVQEANISVEILGRLPASKTAKIFNSMDKEISARLQKQYINMKK